jgi:hypothetical protein
MIGLVPCVIFAQAGLPQQNVKLLAAATGLGHPRALLELVEGRRSEAHHHRAAERRGRVLSGPVILKLVASWMIGVAFGTCTAARSC